MPYSNPVEEAYQKSEHGKAIRRAYRQTPEYAAQQRAYNVRRRRLVAKQHQRIKREVFEHYCGGAPRCMAQNCKVTALCVLQLDHLNGGGNQHRRRCQNHLYRWVRRHGFPAGFQVLCANCNRAKHLGQSWLQ